jgi:hypothetical protein
VEFPACWVAPGQPVVFLIGDLLVSLHRRVFFSESLLIFYLPWVFLFLEINYGACSPRGDGASSFVLFSPPAEASTGLGICGALALLSSLLAFDCGVFVVCGDWISEFFFYILTSFCAYDLLKQSRCHVRAHERLPEIGA